MTEKTEWEVIDVDAPASDARRSQPNPMESMLGRRWKWKLAGTAALGLLALAFVAMLTSMIVLAVAAVTLVSVGARKLVRWLRHGRSSDVVKL